jgi:hypothetical protein
VLKVRSRKKGQTKGGGTIARCREERGKQGWDK